MTLLPGEEKITEASNGLIMLTNKRIRMDSRSSGQEEMISILLRNISSVSVTYKSNPLFLVLAGMLFIADIFLFGKHGAVPIALIVLVLAAASAILYVVFRRHIVQIASKGGRSIDFYISGMSSAMVHEFVHKLESAVDSDPNVVKN